MTNPQSPAAEQKQNSAPRSISKLADLPVGRVLDEEFLELKAPQRENVLVYAPNNVQPKTKDGVKGKDIAVVWVLGTPEYHKNNTMEFFELRRKLIRNNITLDGTVHVPKELIRTLYENAHNDGAKTEQLEDGRKGELHEYYEEMITYALRESVSDIHVEKRSTRSNIRMRKHGQLIEYKEVSNTFADRLCRVIYNVLAENQDVAFREDVFQAASVNTNVDGADVKLRYQSLPVYPGGFDVVLRVLPIGTDEESITPLETLGYSPSQVQTLLDIASKPVGALVIAGTTGSGKSTTLKNLLMYINHSRHYRCKIYTIEDPPEYKIPRVSQIPVIRRETNEGADSVSPFLAPLKATMRGDPDILMIGEIRDNYTGDGLKKATQSGHQVLTTVHATSSLGIVDRLQDFGISPSVMSSSEFLNGLIYQKLVPLVCQECAINFNELIQSSKASKKDIDMSRRIADVADLSMHTIKIRGDGCPKCKGMGIVGRTVCAEIIAPDFNMLQHFRNQDLLEAKYYWRSLSNRDDESDDMKGKTVLEHALLKMRRGLVDPYDIEELMGFLNSSSKEWEQMESDRENRPKKDSKH